ncbi:MAG: Rrf2 family transcriptional regulator [Sphingobium sp. 66-54]|nr:MAG: Rrf2 family transcriptional regulator [Sphingobium sp. 66-54]
MRLTRYTDYAMRVLIYLAVRPGQLSSIREITRAYGVSQSHLMKVVNDLVNAGYLTSVRGRFGGIRLARDPREINVGAVVRHTEDGFELVDCADCVIAPACGLTGALDEALAAFLAVLDGYSLHDLMAQRRSVAALLGMSDAAPPPARGRGSAAAATPAG